MIIDTSVLMAILRDEPEAAKAYTYLSNVDSLKISTGTMFECIIVARAQLGQRGAERLYQTIISSNIEQVPVSIEQTLIAQTAFPKYGKGQGGKAGLNFGDMFAYALAKELNETLFFKGDDFIHTDLKLLRLVPDE